MRYHKPRQNRFRSNNKGFRRNGSQNFRTGDNNTVSNSFQRKSFNRDGFNAEKLLEKYNNLAKEALTSGDKILSESYYQYADHFLRVIENRNLIQNNSKPHLSNSSIEENSSPQKQKNSEKIYCINCSICNWL